MYKSSMQTHSLENLLDLILFFHMDIELDHYVPYVLLGGNRMTHQESKGSLH